MQKDKEVAATGQALDTSTALRQKELADFVAEEEDLVHAELSLRRARHWVVQSGL